eukprot:SAG25_NODE_188_length_12354_cov_23.716116_3_plen_138_part_00
MPLYNWTKCSDGHLEYVNKDKKPDANNEKNWERLHDEYLEKFGLGKKFEKYLKLLQKKAQLQCDFVVKEDRFLLNEIEIADEKIKQLSKNFGGGTSIDASLIHLGKWLGYALKIKETTVVEYYEIMKEYGKWSNKTE